MSKLEKVNALFCWIILSNSHDDMLEICHPDSLPNSWTALFYPGFYENRSNDTILTLIAPPV